MSDNKAILLVTFGTNVTEAANSFRHLENKIRNAFPGVEVRWSYTAKSIRNNLARQGQSVDSPITALSKLQDEGFTRVAVQSVHVLAGQEYYDLVNVVDNMARFHRSSGKHFQSKIGKFGFHRLTLGTPLLYNFEDYREVIEGIRSFVPENPEQALVLVGHGSGHHAFSTYGCLNDLLRHRYPNVFLGTVEGYPSPKEVKQDLSRAGIKQVTLMPLMNIAGEHAVSDLAGSQPGSWKSQLQQDYQVSVNLAGLLDMEDILNIYVKHLREAYNKID